MLVVEVRKRVKDWDMEVSGLAVTGRMNEIHPIGKTVIYHISITGGDDRKCPPHQDMISYFSQINRATIAAKTAPTQESLVAVIIWLENESAVESHP